MLKPVKPRRISDQVFEQLKDLIFRGHIKPGERLPSEREMAETLAVSRPTVREAINKLVVMGLLEHRQGQGTFVKSPGDSEANPLAAVLEGQGAGLRELLEVRLGLECSAAALAARRATEEDINELERNLEGMIASIRSGGLGTDSDLSFHMAIAYATKNSVHVHIMKSFYDLMFYGIKENLEFLYASSTDMDKILGQHRRVFEAIRAHLPEEAFEAMREHITFVVDALERWSGRADANP